MTRCDNIGKALYISISSLIEYVLTTYENIIKNFRTELSYSSGERLRKRTKRDNVDKTVDVGEALERRRKDAESSKRERLSEKIIQGAAGGQWPPKERRDAMVQTNLSKRRIYRSG